MEGVGSERAAAHFCQALGRALGRRVRPLHDAREQKHGEAVQVFHEDVQLIVALVRDGSLAGWTRVSRQDNPEAHPREAARAFLALRRHAQSRHREPCVKLERGRAKSARRDPDIVFPWAEFAHCQSPKQEIIEPWN